MAVFKPRSVKARMREYFAMNATDNGFGPVMPRKVRSPAPKTKSAAGSLLGLFYGWGIAEKLAEEAARKAREAVSHTTPADALVRRASAAVVTGQDAVMKMPRRFNRAR